MIIGIKDGAKLIGISIISLCAVLVCTLFINFNLDIAGIRDEITSPQMQVFYDAQVSSAKLVSLVSGGCLLLTSVVMLLFYIKNYIDTHKKELGILKALGYNNLAVAKHFWVFGLSILLGTAPGYAAACLLMPLFYEVQNKDHILPEVTISFHPTLLICMVAIPTVVFCILAILYAALKLCTPVLSLLKEQLSQAKPNRLCHASSRHASSRHANSRRSHRSNHEDRTRHATSSAQTSFIHDLKKSTLQSKKALLFFIAFASLCFSSTTQMSMRMKEMSSALMSAMVLGIGIILAITTLCIAIATVINGNTKTIAMMRVFGYSLRECRSAMLGGYRAVAYIGFAVGTAYQYLLMKIMVDVVFRDMEEIPAYEFQVGDMLISLAAFALVYELMMYFYANRIRHLSVAQIMLE